MSSPPQPIDAIADAPNVGTISRHGLASSKHTVTAAAAAPREQSTSLGTSRDMTSK